MLSLYLTRFSFSHALSVWRNTLAGVFVFLYGISICFAQQEANNWYFGTNAGVSFASGNPVQVGDGMLNSAEGVASLSDQFGNLLFYTDGVTVYNANHLPMPNGTGLFGGTSSSQSAVAIPVPGSNQLYYLFTAQQDVFLEGIRFSVVDFTLDGGLGDIPVGQKNIQMLTPATEKITAVRHCNGRDYWIIAHEWLNNNFHAWLVSPGGISASPVISSVGAVHDVAVIGCMKASPNGSNLALAVYDQGGQHFIEMFDFNSSTGQITNPLRKDLNGGAYGIEFSPLGQYLYYTSSTSQASTTISIMQMDLCAGSNAAILASSTEIGSTSDGFIRSLQLGPDRKLYFTRFGQNHIGVVPSPDLPAPSCGFIADGVNLGLGISKAGLPNFNQSFFESNTLFDITYGCQSATYSAQPILDEANCKNPVSQILWNFGEPSSGAFNTSSQINPSHTYSGPGTYQVKLILSYPCGNDTIAAPVVISCGLQAVAPNYTICQGSCVDMQVSASGGTPPYTWSWAGVSATTSGPVNVCPTATTTYTVTVTDALGLTNSIPVTVLVNSIPDPTLNITPVSCNGEGDGEVTASYPSGSFSFVWNTLPVTPGPTLSNLDGGIYSLTVTNAQNCQRTIPVDVQEPDELTYNVFIVKSFCNLATGFVDLTMFGGTPPYSFLWSTVPVQTGPSATNLFAGDYSVDVTDANGCVVSLQVTVENTVSHTAYVDMIQGPSCIGYDDAILQAFPLTGTPPFTYLWSNGQTGNMASGFSAGTHTVNVSDASNCPIEYSYTVDDPPGTTFQVITADASCGISNGTAVLNPSGPFGPYSIYWSTNPSLNTSSINGLAPNAYSVTLYDGVGCVYDENFTISNGGAPIIQINEVSPVSCFGVSDGSLEVSISGGQAPYTILWSNGETTQTIDQLPAANYSVFVTDASGCSSSTLASINSPQELIASVSLVDASCSQSNGSIQVNPSGGLSPYSISWSTGANGNTITNLASGPYNSTITDASGCILSQNHTVNNLGGPTLSIVSTDDAVCFGESNGQANLNASGGNLPYSILWPDGSSLLQRTDLAAGNYTVSITDASFCNGSVQVVIDEPAQLQVSWTINSETCGSSNGDASIIVSGGTSPYTYSWSNGSSAAFANSLPAGSISVDVTDASGCSSNFSQSIPSLSAPISAVATTANISCNGLNNGSIQVTGNGAFTVTWSDGFVGADRFLLSGGTYDALVQNSAGCSESISETIIEPAILTANVVSTDASCSVNNGSAEVSYVGGNAPYSVLWSNGETTDLITQIGSGAYQVTITDSEGCIATSSAQINTVSPLTIDQIVVQSASCLGFADGSAEAFVSGNSGAISYLWSSGGNAVIESSLASGNYNLTVSDAAGCSETSSFSIGDGASISFISQLSEPSCFGLNDGSAELLPSTGQAGYSVQWSDGAIGFLRNNLSAGNYYFQLTDANGCAVSDSLELTSPDSLSANILTNPALCGSASGTAEVLVSGGTLPYFYSWSNGDQTSLVNSLLPGNISVLITDAQGCQRNFSEVIADLPAATVQVIENSPVTCNGASDGSLEIVASSPVSTLWNTGQTGIILSSLPAGTYTAYTEDAGGCLDTVMYVLINPLLIEITENAIESNCSASDGSASISILGGISPYSVSWSNGINGNLNAGISAGNYSYSVSDNLGCILTGSILVNSLSSLNIDTIITSEVSCSGVLDGSALANVSGNTGAITYLWSTGSNLSQINNLGAGAYSLEVSDAAGCSDIKNFNITQPAGLQANVSVTDVLCSGQSNGSAVVSSNGGTLPYTYSWSGVLGNNSSTGLSAGSYEVLVSDANGCSVTETFSVEEPDQLIVIIDVVNSTCGLNNGVLNASVSGGTIPYSYSWNTGFSEEDLSGIPSGSFTLEVTDANQCMTSLTKAIIDPGNPVIDNSIVTALSCFNSEDGSIEIFASGGIGNLSYEWSNGDSQSLSENLSSGNYSVVVRDVIGCETSQAFVVTQPAILEMSVSSLDVLCFAGNDGQVSALISGGTSPYTWIVENDNLQIQPNPNQLIAGLYIVRGSDDNNCLVIDTAFVDQPEQLQVSIASSDALCFNSASGFAEATIQGGVLPYVFLWSNNASQAIADSLAAGNYSVDISDANNCSISANVQISEPNELIVQITGPPEVCFDDEFNLIANASGGTGTYIYEWIGGNENETITFVADTSMLWSVTVVDEHQCVAQDSHMLTVNPLPIVEVIPGSLSLCAGECVDVQALAVPGSTYIWKTGEQSLMGQSVNLCFEEAGFADLSLTVTDLKGCTDERLFESYFTIHALPIADFSVSESTLPLLEAVFHFNNQSEGAVEYLWDLNDRIVGEETSEVSLTYTYYEIGEYPVYLTAISEFGCIDEVLRWIKVTQDFAIYLPNAFTPNSDGLNDVFLPSGIGISSDNYRLSIFDRWGNEVFVSTNIEQGWDGMLNNSGNKTTAEGNVYVWKLLLETFDNQQLEYTGRVTVVR
ncbi:MAG: gliding motility-associated C-terminal domain-containing protein [Bacteroidia bacterium]